MRKSPKTPSRGARMFVLLALTATPLAWAATAGEFAPPQPPADLSHGQTGPEIRRSVKTPSKTSKHKPAMVQDGSSFVFAPVKTAGHPAGLQAGSITRQATHSTYSASGLAATAHGKPSAINRTAGRQAAMPALPARLPVPSRPLTSVRIVHFAPVRTQGGRKPRRQKHRARPALPASARLVSTRDYNLLVFPSPLRKAILPPDAPVAGKPIYLNGGRVLMLRFYPDNRQPVQLVAELQSGLVVTLSLVPDPHKSGARIVVRAPVPAAAPLHEYSANPNAHYVRYLARLVAGPMTCPKRLHGWDSVRRHGRRVPVCWGRRLEGFTRAALPPERIYNRLVARPVAAMANGNTVITAYILHARDDRRSVVDPGQFSWVGVRAALLTGDRVDRYHSPVLYVVTGELARDASASENH